VHLAEFPTAAELQAWRNDALIERWERLIEVRTVVNAALEVKRQDKTIGTSLGAKVIVTAAGELGRLLNSVRDELAMLFIVSEVDLVVVDAPDRPIEVLVEKAQGEKCPRCWRMVASVKTDTGLCDRCTGALQRQDRVGAQG